MRVLSYLAIASVLAFAAPALADSMRCGSRLVSEGDSRSAVRSRCGDPVEVLTKSILRRPTYFQIGRAHV